jgi:hypothetical protein
MADFLPEVVLQVGDGATPTEAFANIDMDLIGFNYPNAVAELKDVTDFASDGFREYIAGLKDGADLEFRFHDDLTSTKRAGLITDQGNGATRNFKLTYSDGTKTETTSFALVVQRASPDSIQAGDVGVFVLSGKQSGASTSAVTP